MKILICEDNTLAMKALSVILGKNGYATAIAADGNEAMDMLRNNDYDLLLVDIHLPYHSGLELVEFVRTDLKKDTPVIIVSAFSDPQMIKRAGDLGINDYIVKPIDANILVNKIRLLLNK